MSVFSYTVVDQSGGEVGGTIEAVNVDLAIAALQRRGLFVSKINEVSDNATSLWSTKFTLFERITNADVVMTSRQITTLFEAQVSALRAFRLLAAEARTQKLAAVLTGVANDIQSGSTISAALGKHPTVFSAFYVNMVHAGEESGKLDETFSFLADHLDRNYEVTQKAKNALIYPAFVIFTFVAVMILMMTIVIPHLADMLKDSGQDIPIFTRIIIGTSMFFSRYIILILLFFVFAGVAIYQYARTEKGKETLAYARLDVPVIGMIFKKIFLSRVTDNLSTMLKSGIQILQGLEITASVVEDPVYERVVRQVALDVKAGIPLSDALRKHNEFPGIVVAMVKIGEETGNMGSILETMARFYRREVDNAVDTLVGLIEPIMIVVLAVGVAVLLASVLMPIYNIASSF